MVIARTATRASTGIQQDKSLNHPACPAARGSTGWEQEDPVKHLARPAARGSTGMQQVKQTRHRARDVPRTRSRLLRAVLKPPALVMQVMVATPAQGHAHGA